jgi:hypothetical protein
MSHGPRQLFSTDLTTQYRCLSTLIAAPFQKFKESATAPQLTRHANDSPKPKATLLPEVSDADLMNGMMTTKMTRRMRIPKILMVTSTKHNEDNNIPVVKDPP